MNSESGPVWQMPKRFRVKGLRVAGDLVIDCEVEHGIRDGRMAFEDQPRIIEITKLVRADGEPLGNDPITIDLRSAAIDAVVHGSHLVKVRVRAKGTKDGFMWVAPTGGEEWRAAARVVRQVASEFGGARWTPERDEWLMRAWRHIVDHGCATQGDLADELGVPKDRITDRLRVLRKRYSTDAVPLGKRGRPSKERSEA